MSFLPIPLHTLNTTCYVWVVDTKHMIQILKNSLILNDMKT